MGAGRAGGAAGRRAKKLSCFGACGLAEAAATPYNEINVNFSY